MVKAPVGRPRFLRYLYVTLILFSIHIPLFTVFWYMPSSNASCGSVKSAVGAPHFFKILYLAIAKTSFLTKHFFRKLHLMPIRVLLSSFFSFLLVFYWLSTPYALHMNVNMPPPTHVCNVASTLYALHMNVNMPPPCMQRSIMPMYESDNSAVAQGAPSPKRCVYIYIETTHL